MLYISFSLLPRLSLSTHNFNICMTFEPPLFGGSKVIVCGEGEPENEATYLYCVLSITYVLWVCPVGYGQITTPHSCTVVCYIRIIICTYRSLPNYSLLMYLLLQHYIDQSNSCEEGGQIVVEYINLAQVNMYS